MMHHGSPEGEEGSGVATQDPSLHIEAEQTAPPSLLAYPATYLLMALNAIMFLAMCRVGSQLPSMPLHPSLRGITGLTSWAAQILTAPFSEAVLTAFGSCDPDRVLGAGEWWRLLSSIFVHVTLLHLLLNMWCLWNLGLFGERLLGGPGLVAVYVLTGAAGMLQSVLVSLWQQQLDVSVAGASGAVFGIAGILIVLLSNKKLAAPWEELRSLRLQVIFFAAANLLLGALPGWLPRMMPGLFKKMHFAPGTLPNIDNGAHLGGLLCGVFLGMLLFPRLTSGRSSYRVRQGLVFSATALLLALVTRTLTSFAHVGLK